MRYDTQRREFGMADSPPLIPGRLFAVRGWGLSVRTPGMDPRELSSWRVNAADALGLELMEGRRLPETIRLSAAAHGAMARWEPGENEATCLFSASRDGRRVMRCTCGCTDYKFHIAEAAHRKAEEAYDGKYGDPTLPLECTCGFYGYFAEELERASNLIGSVYGIMEAWGRVIVGSRGLRAQRARVACLVERPLMSAAALAMRNRFITARGYAPTWAKDAQDARGKADALSVRVNGKTVVWRADSPGTDPKPPKDEYLALIRELGRLYDVPVYPDIQTAIAKMPPTPPDLGALKEPEPPPAQLLAETWVGTGVAASPEIKRAAGELEAVWKRRADEQMEQVRKRVERGRPGPGGGIIYRWQQDDKSPWRYSATPNDQEPVGELRGKVVAERDMLPPKDLFPDLPEDPGIKKPPIDPGITEA